MSDEQLQGAVDDPLDEERSVVVFGRVVRAEAASHAAQYVVVGIVVVTVRIVAATVVAVVDTVVTT